MMRWPPPQKRSTKHPTTHPIAHPSKVERRKKAAMPASKKRNAKRKRSGHDEDPSKSSSSSSAEDCCPVLVQYIDYDDDDKSSPDLSISLTPDLDTLLHPMLARTFLETCLRKRAVHVTCRTGSEDQHASTRVAKLRKEMFDLDVESILRETSSDNIFLWLRKQQHQTSLDDDKQQQQRDLIHSIEVSNVETAIALHKTAGHATYCRAPPKVEQCLVASLLRATGLGCGQYDPSGESTVSLGRGEVETFVSTPGHITNWHFDFQENFTIQLSGIKRWTMQQGTIQDPIRGCTPHYASPEAVESQLKAAHLSDRKFQFGHPQTGVNAVGSVQSVLVRPGDVFYFPAGMWHKVETIEPGVSINVSLMAQNYATVVSQAILHYLITKDSQWQQPVMNNAATNGIDTLNGLLKDLPDLLQRLSSSAHFMIPPVLQHAPAFTAVNDGDGGMDAMESDQDCKDGENEEEVDDDEDEVHDDDSGSHSPTGDLDLVEEEDEVIDTNAFHKYPEGWDAGLEVGATILLRRNPWAVLHYRHEYSDFYQSGQKTRPTNDNVFVLNVNYAGNELHQSAVRTVFCDSSSGFVERLYQAFESTTSTPRADRLDEWKTSLKPEDVNAAKFLIYHGYVALMSKEDLVAKSK